MSVTHTGSSRCCRLCWVLLAGPKTYRLFNKAGTFSPLGVLLCQYSEASLEVEKEKNQMLCQHCYRELNTLSTGEMKLLQNKEELKEKMRKADVYFTRMKRCRGSKNVDSILSAPVREESIMQLRKGHVPGTSDSPERPSSSRTLFQSPVPEQSATCVSDQERSKLASKLPTLLPRCKEECGIQVSFHDLEMEVRQFQHIILFSLHTSTGLSCHFTSTLTSSYLFSFHTLLCI